MVSDALQWLEGRYDVLARDYPSAVVLAGLLCGLLPFAAAPGAGALRSGAWTLAALATFLLLLPGRKAIKPAAWALVGFAVVWWGSAPRGSNYAVAAQGDVVRGELMAVCVDAIAPESPEPWLKPDTYLPVRVERLRLPPDQEWRAASGKLFVKPPQNWGKPPSYGKLLRISGVFLEPRGALTPNDFDSRKYLRCQGVWKTFFADKIEVVGSAGFPDDALALAGRLRDRCLSALAAGLPDDTKAFLAGITLGYRQSVPAADKRNFVRSGTVHILAISGMHVVVIAAVLALLLRWVPHRIRYLSLPTVLALYIFLIGAPPSAVRALVMITVVCVFKALLARQPHLNGLAFAAVVLLLVNPFTINDLGFQYSFTVTAFLLLPARLAKEWGAAAKEKSRWIAPGHSPWTARLTRRSASVLAQALLYCVIASLASAAITLRVQNLFIPLSFLINFVAVPFSTPLLLLSFAKVTLAFTLGSWTASWLDWPLNFLSQAFCALCGYGAQNGCPEYLPTPPLWTVLAYYLALYALVLSRRRLVSTAALASLVALTLLWQALALWQRPQFLVYAASRSDSLALAFAPGGGNGADVVDCPKQCWPLTRSLIGAGVNRVDTLFLAGIRADRCAGTPLLLANFPAELVLLPANAHISPSGKNALAACRADGAAMLPYQETPDGFDLKLQRRSWSADPERHDLRYSRRFQGRDYSMAVESGGGLRRVTLMVDGATIRVLDVEHANVDQLFAVPARPR